jgi:hypothetical protein
MEALAKRKTGLSTYEAGGAFLAIAYTPPGTQSIWPSGPL